MRMPIRSYIAVLLIMAFISCNTNQDSKNDRLLAMVDGYSLHESELAKHLPTKMTISDSLKFTKDFIDQWIKEYLLVAESEKQLSSEEQDFQEELEAYRKELLAYRYQNSKMSELISEDIPYVDIENYYQNNKDKYILTTPIVQVSYIIFPSEINLSDRFKKLITSIDPEDIGEAEEFIFQYAIRYDKFDNNWVYFSSILNNVDIKINNIDEFLQSEKLIKINKSNELHIIAIREFLSSGATAPIEFVLPTIKSFIVNQKKLDFLREIKDSLYYDALKYNKFRVFNY